MLNSYIGRMPKYRKRGKTMDNNFNENNGTSDNSVNLSKEPENNLNQDVNNNQFNGGNSFHYTPQPNVNEPDPGHGMAIASLVLGIVSILSCCCVYLSVVAGVVGVVLAILSKNKSKNNKFEGLAIAGLICSIIGVVISVGYIIYVLVVMKTPEFQNMYQQILEQNSNL